MKKFSFSMQKILELREFEKKEAQSELGKAVMEETKIKETLEMIAQQRVATVAEESSVKDIYAIDRMYSYLNLLEQRKNKLLEELVQAQLVTEQKRKLMEEAMQRVKVLENLRDKKKEEWVQEIKKAENKEVDDINNSRFAK